MGAQVDVTRNLEKQATTKDIRSGYGSIAQPMEDYIVGGISGDKGRQQAAEKDFFQALIDTEAKVTASAQNFLTTTMTDISNRFKEAYMQPQKVETKSEINVNVNITGDENTRSMDATQIQNVVKESFAKPEFSIAINGQLAGGNQPSATTGSKNK
jgi:transcription antitermination factor NusG